MNNLFKEWWSFRWITWRIFIVKYFSLFRTKNKKKYYNDLLSVVGFYVTVVGKAETHWDKEKSLSYRSGDTRTIEYYTGINQTSKISKLIN